ncbi:MAG TPA: hypothetical protein VK836_11740 [Streptosporangiaceae bacterium]|nr:hypothetical protein [Streptosporangiaceae bacterium]
MNDDADSGNRTGMDIHEAAAIMQDTTERARRALIVRRPVVFAVWGVAWLVADGAIWLSVRGQHPYIGPTPASLVALTIVAAAAAAITAVLVGRAGSGVGGWTVLQRRIFLLSYLGGYIALFTLEAAIDHAGASRAVLGVYGAAAPILLVALVIAASSALNLDWSVFGLGIWLLAVAAGSGFAGPVGVWAVSALAGGAALLLMAASGLRRRSRE